MWLPSDFGKKAYEDMSEKEKEVVISFGIEPEEYNKLSGGNDYLRLTE